MHSTFSRPFLAEMFFKMPNIKKLLILLKLVKDISLGGFFQLDGLIKTPTMIIYFMKRYICTYIMFNILYSPGLFARVFNLIHDKEAEEKAPVGL